MLEEGLSEVQAQSSGTKMGKTKHSQKCMGGGRKNALLGKPSTVLGLEVP